MIKRYKMRGDLGFERVEPSESGDGEWVKWEDVKGVLSHLEDTLDELCDHAEKTKDLAWTLQVQVAREDDS